ncbi:MAG: 4-(cytidine 5'-diphospho)-2-C-methyl-D-erythritol kinase [Rhizomicrobium sp.]
MATRPESVRVFAPAKINLFLHVERKRRDGYHDLQSLVAFADIGDELTVARADGFSLALDGPFAHLLSGEPDNLVLKAARSLAAHLASRDGAHFTLTKNLPVASGIGGGSADAAAALRGLLALWKRDDADADQLNALAAALGSDIPVCLRSRPAWMEGRGERVLHLPLLPRAGLVLVNPGVAVSTADVFRRVVPDMRDAGMKPPGEFGTLDELVRYLGTTRNDLEASARAIAPVIGEALDALSRHGAAFARMSGSGATCFGLFKTDAQAHAAAASIAQAQPAWWARAGGFAIAEAGDAHSAA